MGAENIGFVSSGFVFSWLSISGFGAARGFDKRGGELNI